MSLFHPFLRTLPSARFTALLFGSLAFGLWPADASALTITDRVFPVYNRGDVHIPCIAIDGGVVPIDAPPGASMTSSGGAVTFTWPDGKAVATYKNASLSESSLIDKDGNPAEQAAWESAVDSQIDRSATGKLLHDFQPKILPINHWKIGAIAYDYQIAGTKWTTLLLVWRCVDGMTISVKVFARAGDFEDARSALYQMIGGTMLLKN